MRSEIYFSFSCYSLTSLYSFCLYWKRCLYSLRFLIYSFFYICFVKLLLNSTRAREPVEIWLVSWYWSLLDSSWFSALFMTWSRRWCGFLIFLIIIFRSSFSSLSRFSSASFLIWLSFTLLSLWLTAKCLTSLNLFRLWAISFSISLRLSSCICFSLAAYSLSLSICCIFYVWSRFLRLILSSWI